MIAPRCAGCPCQRCPERGAAKLAKLRLAQTDAAPFPAPGTADTARSTGFHCNGNGNRNRNRNRRCADVKDNSYDYCRSNGFNPFNNARIP